MLTIVKQRTGAHRTAGRPRSLLIMAALLMLAACGDTAEDGAGSRPGTIQAISDADHLQKVMERSDNRLAMVEFYADWCAPCKTLGPVLERLATEHRDQMAAYKVDVDQLRSVLPRLGIRGIPHVMFFKNGELIQEVMGLHPRSTYSRIIDTHM